MNTDSLSQAIVKLFNQERFYAELVSQMSRVFSTTLDAAAGVCIKDTIQLHINSELFDKHSIDERSAILKHECQHIFNDHIFRSKEYAPEVYSKDKKDDIESNINRWKHTCLNIAADLAINGGIPGLPEGCMHPTKFDLPVGQTMEWYMDNLKNNEKAKEFMDFEGHSLWAESEGEKEILREKVRQAVNKAAEKARAAGKMSSDDELLVSKINHRPRYWKSELRRFVARSAEYTLDTSKKKRNRRYGILYPGVIKTESLTIAACVDTSGSMSEEALNQIAAELDSIHKTGTKIWVIEADAEVKNVWEFDPNKLKSFKGRGGTAYDPAIKYASRELEVDGIMYFGDFDTSDVPDRPRIPVLWVGVNTTQKPPAGFGQVIYAEINRK